MFFTQLQSQIETSCGLGDLGCREIQSLNPNRLGARLGLLLIVEQHRAIIGNLLIWILGKSARSSSQGDSQIPH